MKTILHIAALIGMIIVVLLHIETKTNLAAFTTLVCVPYVVFLAVRYRSTRGAGHSIHR